MKPVEGQPTQREDEVRRSASGCISEFSSIGGQLRALEDEHPQCVFIVRRCHSLGFQSSELLAQHYSEFGQVRRVLVMPSTVKCAPKKAATRVRPGSIGFIVMADAGSVERILREGGEQTVAGKTVTVGRFRHCQQLPPEPLGVGTGLASTSGEALGGRTMESVGHCLTPLSQRSTSPSSFASSGFLGLDGADSWES
jgi:hypothetical protein